MSALEASNWYRKAAEQGHVEAQYSLGSMFEEGRSHFWGFGRNEKNIINRGALVHSVAVVF